MKLRLILAALILAILLAGCEHPAWANYEVIVKDAVGEPVTSYHCITYRQEGMTLHCEQPEEMVEVEIRPGWKVQVWTLPKPMP